MRPAPLLVRAPCDKCGQPIAADLPLAPGTAAAMRCTTCGAVQMPRGASTQGGAQGRASAATRDAPPTWRGTRTQRVVLAVLLVTLAGTVSYRVFFAREEAYELGGPGSAPAPVWTGRRTALRWRARVADAGEWLTPGTECVVRGTFRSDLQRIVGAELAMDCGTVALYRGRSRDGLGCDVHEGPGIGFGVWEYHATCRDGRGLVFDTHESHARIEGTALRPGVSLAVVPDDGVHAGPPLYERSVGIFRWRRDLRFAARVDKRAGDRAPALGEACDAVLLPNSSDDVPCRARITCGEHIAYGGFGAGFTHCVLGGDGPTLATDDDPTGKDGDPVLRFDVSNLRATVRDEGPDWSAEFALVPVEASAGATDPNPPRAPK